MDGNSYRCMRNLKGSAIFTAKKNKQCSKLQERIAKNQKLGDLKYHLKEKKKNENNENFEAMFL